MQYFSIFDLFLQIKMQKKQTWSPATDFTAVSSKSDVVFVVPNDGLNSISKVESSGKGHDGDVVAEGTWAIVVSWVLPQKWRVCRFLL